MWRRVWRTVSSASSTRVPFTVRVRRRRPGGFPSCPERAVAGPPEEAGNDHANRYGVDALIWRKLGTTQLWVQGDYGRERANAALPTPTQDAQWWAWGGWMTFDLNTSLGLALRGDYLNDENGARTSLSPIGPSGFPLNTGQKLSSSTVTLNIRAWPNAVVRPEVRYDRSTLAAFGGKKDQVSVALSVAYLY